MAKRSLLSERLS